MTLFGKLAWWRGANDKDAKGKSDLYLFGSSETTKVLFVTVLGVASENLEEILDLVAVKFTGYQRIVYVTDHPDFLVFRERQATFEYIPSLSAQAVHGTTMDWPSYLKARWELLLTKWQPDQILSYGLNIDRFLFAASHPGAVYGR